MESAYAVYQIRMDGGRFPPMEVDYSAEIKNFPTWVAEYNGKIVGGLIMTFEAGNASIANVAVYPEFQGQGLGGGFLNLAESIAQEKDYSELHLTTHVLLSENLSFYRHMGWQETARDAVRVYMKKEL